MGFSVQLRAQCKATSVIPPQVLTRSMNHLYTDSCSDDDDDDYTTHNSYHA